MDKELVMDSMLTLGVTLFKIMFDLIIRLSSKIYFDHFSKGTNLDFLAVVHFALFVFLKNCQQRLSIDILIVSILMGGIPVDSQKYAVVLAQKLWKKTARSSIFISLATPLIWSKPKNQLHDFNKSTFRTH